MEYKALHTEEEFADVTTWFRERLDRLPKSLRVDQATYIPDLRKTVERYFDFIAQHRGHRRFGGQLDHLFRMRHILQEQGFK